MSTRCQVQVVGEDEKFTLYHHWDGYPSNMVKLLCEAYASFKAKPRAGGTAGKAVSFVVAADPDGYEVEEGHELHGDIEWYYRLFAGKTWELEINTASYRQTGLTVVVERSPLSIELAKLAEPTD